MKMIRLIKSYILIVFLLTIETISYAHTPVWLFTPLTATTISVPSNGTATIQYQITNQSEKSHSLVMTPIPGITQITTNAGSCSIPFNLPHKGSSCTLSLSVNGSQLTHIITGGPIVCEQNNRLQCYQPSRKDALNITPATAPTIANITSTSSYPAVFYGTNMNWLGDSPALYIIFYCQGQGCNINDYSEIPTGPIDATSMQTDSYSWWGYSTAICPADELSYNQATCSNIYYTPIANITSTSSYPGVLYGTNINWLGDTPALYIIFYCQGQGCDINSNSETPTGPIDATSMETDSGSWGGYSVAICPADELSYNQTTCSNIYYTPIANITSTSESPATLLGTNMNWLGNTPALYKIFYCANYDCDISSNSETPNQISSTSITSSRSSWAGYKTAICPADETSYNAFTCSNIYFTPLFPIAVITATTEPPATLLGTNMNWLGNTPEFYKIYFCPGEGCDINSGSEIPTGPIDATSMVTDDGSWSGYSASICPADEPNYNQATCSNIYYTP